jgi:CHAT domain-containing protein/tetratricopeptide (TPR) repeat protein
MTPEDPTGLGSEAPALVSAMRAATEAHERSDRSKSLRDVEAAVGLWRQVFEAPGFASASAPLRHEAFTRFATLHLDRWNSAGREADLDAAVDHFAQALAIGAERASDASRTNLATTLIARYDRMGNSDDLTRATELLERSVANREPDDLPPWLATALASALLYQFQRAGDLADLDRSITLLTGPAAFTLDPLEQAHRLSTLGNALSDRYAVGGDLRDLDASIDCLEQALDARPPGTGPARASALANLGASLRERFRERGEREDIDKAIKLQQEAVSLAPHVLGYHNNLALAYSQRSRVTNSRTDLDLAIAGHLRVLSHTAEASPDLPGYLTNYAAELRMRGELTRSVTDLETAIEAYLSACRLGLETNIELALRAAFDWATWAAARGSWEEAAQAYQYGLAASDRLVRTQLARGRKEMWLRSAQELPTRAAFALAKADRLDEAVLTVERGRALLLSEHLERSRAALAGLGDAGRRDLAGRFRDVVERLDEIEHRELSEAASEDRLRNLRATQDELEQLINEIRSVPGNEHFLAPPTLDDVMTISARAPLVYLLSTEAGGLALIVREGEIRALWLNDLALETVYEQIRGYLHALVSVKEHDSDENEAAWASTLERTTQWLWYVVMEDLLDAVAPAERLWLVAAGQLSLLPLHAAWKFDVDAPTGRRYASDAIVFTYVPNARAAAEAERLATSLSATRLLAVAEPTTAGRGPLASASHEAAAAEAAFAPNARSLEGAEATRAAVRAGIANSDVIHFACHGEADLDQPLDSALLLAGDDRLTVRDLLAARVNARLAVLSACETGVAGLALPDEVVGLPVGLLQAGAAGVIASLWEVPDADTMMLMVEFYRRWRGSGTPPASALRDAQAWIRDTTNAQKASQYNAMLDSGLEIPLATVEALMREVGKGAPAERSFEDIADWAAFIHIGA